MIKSHWRHLNGAAFLILLFTSLCARSQTSQPAAAKVETKTGTITGRVVNENGEPHVNFNVWVRPDTPQELPATLTTTNREGVFKVSGLEPRSYTVSTAGPAHIPKSPYAAPAVYKAEELVTLVLVKGGVVTGTVANAKGDPVVGIGVRVRMTRDESGRSYGDLGRHYDSMTDDRGVYRVYGLPTGTYVVSTDGNVEERTSWRINVNEFANDLPTYAPSSNREDADEFSVRTGEETSDVNIRHRGEPGQYSFAMRFSAQQWFLQSITLAPPSPNVKPADVTRTWTTVNAGDKLSALTFTLAQGAAFIRGEISLAEGQKLPEKLVAFLIPAEPERADEVLRYYAAPVNSEGRFWLANVAPGRYWILSQHGTDDTRYEVSKIRLPDGAETRSSLRHAAEAVKTEIELKPCQDLTFRLPL